MCGGFGWAGGGRDLVVSIVDTVTPRVMVHGKLYLCLAVRVIHKILCYFSVCFVPKDYNSF